MTCTLKQHIWQCHLIFYLFRRSQKWISGLRMATQAFTDWVHETCRSTFGFTRKMFDSGGTCLEMLDVQNTFLPSGQFNNWIGKCQHVSWTPSYVKHHSKTFIVNWKHNSQHIIGNFYKFLTFNFTMLFSTFHADVFKSEVLFSFNATLIPTWSGKSGKTRIASPWIFRIFI